MSINVHQLPKIILLYKILIDFIKNVVFLLEYYLKDATPVYVGNLPVNIKRVKLLKLFKKFGKILSIRFRTNTGKSFYKKSQVEKVPYLIAFVYFDTREAAEASVECNGTKIGDNVISVDVDHKENKVIKPQTTVVVGNLKFGNLSIHSIIPSYFNQTHY